MDSIWTFIDHQLANNQFFSGGLILMIGGAALAALRNVPARMYTWLRDRGVIEIDIPDRELAFEWLDKWLAAHTYSRDHARRLTVRSETATYTDRTTDPGGDHRPRIIFSPAPGEHWLFYRGRLAILHRHRNDTERNQQGQVSSSIRETFSITILSRDRSLARQLLEDAREFALPRADQKLTIHYVRYNSWNEQLQRLPRPADSVILQAGLLEDLIAEARTFLEGRDWYLQRGIPYRRGYLLHGPPGTGKSSTVVAVASALGMDIAVLNLNSATLDDNELSELLAETPANALVLVEDIDCAFVARQAGDDKANKVTFSGLLNAIDGVAAGEGRILFATTNHLDRLDPALIRPGRIDRQIEIGLATREQIRRLFLRFFPEADSALTDRFAASLPDRRLSMSALQTHLIRHAACPLAAVENAHELLAKPTPPPLQAISTAIRPSAMSQTLFDDTSSTWLGAGL
jgi:chaperone BCS1